MKRNIYEMKKEDWFNNLLLGEWGESVVLTHILSRSNGRYKVLENKSNKSEYDFKLEDLDTGEIITFEVKLNIWITTPKRFDRGHNTHYIETRSNNIQSGLRVCTSDYWITYYPLENRLYIIKTDDLKANLKNGTYTTGNGNKGLSCGFLLPRQYLGYQEYTSLEFYEYDNTICPEIINDLKDFYLKEGKNIVQMWEKFIVYEY
jgi:hypothetical protein